MAAPRPAVLVLLLVLVAVIVLFVVGQGLGAQQPRGMSEADISSLEERFFGSAPRVRWPPGSRCAEILPGKSCTLEIPRGKGLLRKVSIATASPMSIDFVPASTPGRTVTLDMTKDHSKPADLYVDSKGGRLTLTCAVPIGSKCTPLVN